VNLIEASRKTASVAVEGTTAEPGMARAPIPGDDPIVQGEPERRHAMPAARLGFDLSGAAN
jgi:hypothetical protein